MAYHKIKIEKGIYGEFSKIIEEFEELKDAHNQGNSIMELIELSDLLGAIEGYVKSKYNDTITLKDLLVMKDATCSAFEDGTRVVK